MYSAQRTGATCTRRPIVEIIEQFQAVSDFAIPVNAARKRRMSCASTIVTSSHAAARSNEHAVRTSPRLHSEIGSAAPNVAAGGAPRSAVAIATVLALVTRAIDAAVPPPAGVTGLRTHATIRVRTAATPGTLEGTAGYVAPTTCTALRATSLTTTSTTATASSSAWIMYYGRSRRVARTSRRRPPHDRECQCDTDQHATQSA